MKRFCAHVLVLEAFRGPRPSPRHDASHLDGTPTNNALDNLQWETKSQNMARKYEHGRQQTGENNPFAKLTAAQVAEIRRRSAAGESHRKIAVAFGVNPGTCDSIVSGKTWKGIALCAPTETGSTGGARG